MFKYLTLILFSIFVNGNFTKSVLLEDIKFIKFINISFSDDKRSNQKQFISINSAFLENEIIFSDIRQDMLLGSFILKNPLGVRSLRISYLDSYGESREKIVYVDKGSLSSKQLYFYEKGDYFYKHNKVKKNLNFKIKDNIIFEDNLPISYDDKDAFIDISFNKCNDGNEDCNDMKFSYWDKRVIFYFRFKTKHDKKMNLSQNIKRIQIINKAKNQYPTWVVVEATKKIVDIRKLDSSSAKNVQYRIYIE